MAQAMQTAIEFYANDDENGRADMRAARDSESGRQSMSGFSDRVAVPCGRKGAAEAQGTDANTGVRAQSAPGNFGLRRRALERRRVNGKPQGLFGRFLMSRCGATMVEFALVGPLFLLLTFAIVDNGLVLFEQTILDNATREAARQIRIGKVQLSGDTDGTGLFKTTLCNNLGGFIPCGSLQWNVQSVNSAGAFSSITATTANGSGQMSSTGFTPGTAQYFVLVQVGYTQRYIMPFLNKMAGATGNLLLLSNVAFQSEHYQ